MSEAEESACDKDMGGSKRGTAPVGLWLTMEVVLVVENLSSVI